MANSSNTISQRKKEHLQLCLTGDVSFKEKRNGFDNYDFKHYAITEVNLNKISFKTDFLGKKINYPFLISCMTGGTEESENINAKLAIAANELNIPLGVGSQRQALESTSFHNSYKVIRKNAPHIPILGNIGASQLVLFKSFKPVQMLADLINADAMAVHLNSLQELMQKKGEPKFTGLLKSLAKLVESLDIPVVVKEVGAGISKEAAKKILQTGVKGIDVAGAGGTSWAGVEILRNKEETNYFWDWGLPTSYCLRKISKLKNEFDFYLIGSGGINNAIDMAKAFALGAEITASARTVLIQLDKNGVEGVISLVKEWFEILRKILFLTGSSSLAELQNKKLVRKDKLN
ncbi:MAG: type 2 isopentenyl-diphosphate Delta-isomerase [Ignavibacteriaceae bacterium]